MLALGGAGNEVSRLRRCDPYTAVRCFLWTVVGWVKIFLVAEGCVSMFVSKYVYVGCARFLCKF